MSRGLILEPLAKGCAILGGVLLTLVTLHTGVDIVARGLGLVFVQGSYELTAYAAAAAIALFMPLCQTRRAHILVDFFTSRCGAHVNRRLDRLGAGLSALVFALLTWRSLVGGLRDLEVNAASMIMNLPNGLVYAAMIPAFALSSTIALSQALGLARPPSPLP